MSTFKGRLNEEVFKGCVIDYFENDVLEEGKVFFLSHFHTDHMRGLWNPSFCERFSKDRNLILCCSKITKKFILKSRLNEIPENQIIALEKNHLDICPYDCTIRVTLLRAGHCPGSVMFLFESCGVTALYTGDFRISKEDLALCKPLHDEDDGKVIQINSLYLDTTFASSDYSHFPSRERSKDNIIRLIKGRSVDIKYISIQMPALTGFEYLMVELYKEFNKPVHVSHDLCFQVISCIEQLVDVVTNDLQQSFIHFCNPRSKSLGSCDPCPHHEDNWKILTIKPTAQFFHTGALKVGEVLHIQFDPTDPIRVAYSSHSSLSEIIELIAYLKPSNIYPSVVREDQTPDEILKEIALYAICDMGIDIWDSCHPSSQPR